MTREVPACCRTAESSPPTSRSTWTCCIVGAGPAGISIARELAGNGARVWLLESGGKDVRKVARNGIVSQTVVTRRNRCSRLRRAGWAANQDPARRWTIAAPRTSASTSRYASPSAESPVSPAAPAEPRPPLRAVVHGTSRPSNCWSARAVVTIRSRNGRVTAPTDAAHRCSRGARAGHQRGSVVTIPPRRRRPRPSGSRGRGRGRGSGPRHDREGDEREVRNADADDRCVAQQIPGPNCEPRCHRDLPHRSQVRRSGGVRAVQRDPEEGGGAVSAATATQAAPSAPPTGRTRARGR